MSTGKKVLKINRYEWSLDALHKGYDDPAFQSDLKQYHDLRDELSALTEEMNTLGGCCAMKEVFQPLEKEYGLSDCLHMYTILRQSVDINGKQTLRYLNIINLRISSYSVYRSQLEDYLAHIKHMDSCIQQGEMLKEYSFLLHTLKDKASHSFRKEEGAMPAKLSQTSTAAFSDMYYHPTASVPMECLEQTMILTQVKNLCHPINRDVRKEAFLCEMKTYESIKEPLVFSINNIKCQQLMEVRMWGYEDPLDKMLQDSFMKKEILSTMYAAVDKYLPRFCEYLRTKAELLGYDNGLPWYEIYASLGTCDMSFTIEGCEAYIQQHFRNFSTNLYDMTKQAIDGHWIDYPSHTRKQSGVFCEDLVWIKRNKVITNYRNTLSDIITVAYELGHAYHGTLVENERPLNREYCMLLAETASTLDENIMYRALINDADHENKLFLIDTQLSVLCQNIRDIATRYTFEKSVFEQCEERFMFISDLTQLMLEAEKKCLKDGLDPNWLHPYRWIAKVRYYIPDTAFYNLLYTFGILFSSGLYTMYEKEEEAFLPRYRALLKASTTHTVEETAAITGIDLEDAALWEASLESIIRQMGEFLILAKETAQNQG